jgi:segregation and condensation protein B
MIQIESPQTDQTASLQSPESSIDPRRLAAMIEAVLLCADRPVPAIRLAEAADLVAPQAESEDAPLHATAPATDDAALSSGASPAPDSSTDHSASSPAPATDAPAPLPEPKKQRRRRSGQSDDHAAAVRKQALTAIKSAVEHLNAEYAQTGRSFRIEALAGGYRIMTLPDFAQAVARFHGARARTSLSHAALETLAIISYKQPITRARLEAIRGVACGEILRSLIDRRLITIAGRAEELGRPILYGTTRRFLELFGLASLKDLPSVDEIRPKT